MNFTVMLFSVSALLLVLAMGRVLYRLAKPGTVHSASLEWLDEFSLDKYVPMERLLDEADFKFLASQPGYDPSIAKRLRCERRLLFREYLTHLKADFYNLHTLARIMIVCGQQDQSELAAALNKQRLEFYRGVLLLECRVTLAPLGVSVSGVGQVVRSLGNLRGQLGEMVPSELSA